MLLLCSWVVLDLFDVQLLCSRAVLDLLDVLLLCSWVVLDLLDVQLLCLWAVLDLLDVQLLCLILLFVSCLYLVVSYCLALLLMISDIVTKSETGNITLLSLLDMSAAFDTVDHASWNSAMAFVKKFD